MPSMKLLKILACGIWSCAILAWPQASQATEIKVLASPNMRALLTDITPDLQATGNTMSIAYDSAEGVSTRVATGQPVDVAITLRPLLDRLSADGKARTPATIGRSFIAVVVPAGAPKPDISSISAFKRALLAARSVVYSDPSKGGLSGIFTARLIRQMGIEDAMREKTRLVPPGGAALVETITKGDAQIGIDQLTVVDRKPGVDVVGILPHEFGADIVMGIAVAANTSEPEAANALLKVLASPAVAAKIKARGMEPGQ